MPRHYALAIVILAAFSGLRGNHARAVEPQVYEAYAVRFAVARGCPVSFLVEGADRERKVDLAMMFWVLKAANGRTILVDAGFYRPKTVQGYGAADFEQPDRALEGDLARAHADHLAAHAAQLRELGPRRKASAIDDHARA